MPKGTKNNWETFCIIFFLGGGGGIFSIFTCINITFYPVTQRRYENDYVNVVKITIKPDNLSINIPVRNIDFK